MDHPESLPIKPCSTEPDPPGAPSRQLPGAGATQAGGDADNPRLPRQAPPERRPVKIVLRLDSAQSPLATPPPSAQPVVDSAPFNAPVIGQTQSRPPAPAESTARSD